MTATTFDLIVLGVMVLSGAVSLIRGFAREVLTLVAMFGAGYAAYAFGPAFFDTIRDWLTDGGTLPKDAKVIYGMVPVDIAVPAVSYGAVFLLTFIVLSIAAAFVGKIIKELGLGPIDKTLGVFFGLARGFLVIALLFYPVTFLIGKDEMPKWVTSARSAPALFATSEQIDKALDVDSETKTQKAKEADTKAVAAEKDMTPAQKDELQKIIDTTLKSPEASAPAGIDAAPLPPPASATPKSTTPKTTP